MWGDWCSGGRVGDGASGDCGAIDVHIVHRRRDEQHVDVVQVQVLFEQHRVPRLEDALTAHLQ